MSVTSAPASTHTSSVHDVFRAGAGKHDTVERETRCEFVGAVGQLRTEGGNRAPKRRSCVGEARSSWG